MKIFFNYFASNLILPNILKIVAIYLFQYFVSYITVIKNGFAKYFENCCNLFISVFCFAHYSVP